MNNTKLKPWALVKRLRPAQLAVVTQELRTSTRLYQALKLLRELFPPELEREFDGKSLRPHDWHRALGIVCALVEQHGWVPINWEALNEAWAHWMQTEDDHGDHLAAYLYYIPLQMYGFSDHEKIYEFPPMELLRALLAEVEAVSSTLLIEAELYDTLDQYWDAPQRQSAWEQLEQIESNPLDYPEPARFLPELARWACGRTGNPLLDRHFDPYEHGPWFTWAEDLPQIRRLWRRTAPVVEMFHRLMTWYEQDTSRIAKITHFFMNGGQTDEFDW